MSLCPWVYCAEATERCLCIHGFTMLKPRRDFFVSLGLVCCSHGEMSLCPWVYYAEATERYLCIHGFTMLKPRRDFFVSLGLLC